MKPSQYITIGFVCAAFIANALALYDDRITLYQFDVLIVLMMGLLVLVDIQHTIKNK